MKQASLISEKIVKNIFNKQRILLHMGARLTKI